MSSIDISEDCHMFFILVILEISTTTRFLEKQSLRKHPLKIINFKNHTY
jgi:hypothetical protein